MNEKYFDSYLKGQLLTMIEWYEHALHGEDYQTFYDGRYLEKWTDKDTLERLKGCFSTYNPVNMEKALINTVNLFTEKAKYFSEKKDYPFPINMEDKLFEWIENNYTNRSVTGKNC